MVESGWMIMGIEVKNVELLNVTQSALPASSTVAQKPPKEPTNSGQNADAVKISLATNASNEQIEAERKELKAKEEEQQRRFREQAEKNFAETAVQFLPREGGTPADMQFRVVEKESGRVLVEYPLDVAIKKMGKAMDEQEEPGQVIDKAV